MKKPKYREIKVDILRLQDLNPLAQDLANIIASISAKEAAQQGYHDNVKILTQILQKISLTTLAAIHIED